MKVAVYARISTQDQSSDNQKDQILRYCRVRGYEIYNIYKDVCSGKNESRPSFDNLIDDMRRGSFDAIAVYKLDRIGRSLQHLLQLFQEFKNLNIAFISVTQNINTDTPEGRLMLRMLMLLAEYEREMIVARTRDTLSRYKRDIDEQGFFVTRDGKRKKKR